MSQDFKKQISFNDYEGQTPKSVIVAQDNKEDFKDYQEEAAKIPLKQQDSNGSETFTKFCHMAVRKPDQVVQHPLKKRSNSSSNHYSPVTASHILSSNKN